MIEAPSTLSTAGARLPRGQALRSGLAAMWPTRIGAETGGLMSYANNVLDRWRRAYPTNSRENRRW